MKKKLYLTIMTLLLTFNACDEKPNKQNISPLNQNQKSEKIKNIPKEYHYEFKNLEGQTSILDIKNDLYNFKNIEQEIVLINIMSTWCPSCRGQIPHLSKLQQKFKKNLFVISMLVHDDILKKKLNKFIIAQKILYYVSVTQEENLNFTERILPRLGLTKEFPMPLTIVFIRGKYFTHYEGMIPEEMIESDIKQLLKKIKK